jgi:predicted amidohydrolase YtcJ
VDAADPYAPTVTTTLYSRGRVRSPADPFATALLVEDGVVAWVGSDAAGAALQADVTVDLADAWVAPAFVDAHVHSTTTGLALTGLDLASAPSLAVLLSRVEQASRAVRGGVVLGTGWEEDGWPSAGPRPPPSWTGPATGEWSTSPAPTCTAPWPPAPCSRSSRRRAGWTAGSATAWSRSRRTPRCAGRLRRPDDRAAAAAQRAVRRHAASLGIGCLHECGGPGHRRRRGLRPLLALAAAEPGPAVLGYWAELAADGGLEHAEELGAHGAGGDLFVDGSLGSHTACLGERYDDVDTLGYSYLDTAQVADHVAACCRAGVQAGFHAIGDAALTAVLDGFAAAADQVGLDVLRAGRHRVEHVELPTAQHVQAMADLGLVASVQPVFDARWAGPAGCTSSGSASSAPAPPTRSACWQRPASRSPSARTAR